MKVWWKLSVLVLFNVAFFLFILNMLFSPDNRSNDFQVVPTERSTNLIQSTSGSPRKALSKPSLRHSILLLSSVGRSGSSFLGELLASQDNNIYFYEPIRALNNSLQTEDVIKQELVQYYHCNIRQSMLNIGTRPSINVKHKYVFGKKKNEVNLPKLVELCLQEPLLIIKTIRTRLRWARDLMDRPDLNLKVVHLVRDPRGTHISMDKVEWNIDYKDKCDIVFEDLEEKKHMERLYPDRYYFVKYEDFCRDPYRQANNLFRFLNAGRVNDTLSTTTLRSLDRDKIYNLLVKSNLLSPGDSLNNLPDKAIRFLMSHTLVNPMARKTPWTTVRNTLTTYQEWRTKITQEDLSSVEQGCILVLQRLRHILFHNVTNARDLTIPLFASSHNKS